MRPIKPSDLSDGVKALSDDLSAAAGRVLGKKFAPQLKTISARLRDGDFEAARAEARDLDFDAAAEALVPQIRKFMRSTTLLGAGAVDSPKTSIFANGAPFPWEVDEGGVRLIKRMIAHILGRDTLRRIEDRITTASKFQKAADIDPVDLARDINRYLRGEIMRVTDVASNVVGTRTAAYGMYYEARARGISKYRIDAILDTRTTDICRHMDGRTFSVEEAFTKTGEVLSVADPTKIKDIAPFPELDEIGGLSNDELQARGFDTPPFHFLCRSVVTLIDTEKEYDPVAWSNFPEVGRDATAAFRAVKPQFDREAKAVWGTNDLDELFTVATRSFIGDDAPKEISYANSYTGNSYFDVNDRLRANKPFEAGSDGPAIVKTMDSLVAASESPDVAYVYRGLSKKATDRMEIGKVFQDDAFMSTSLDPEVVLDFAKVGKTILQIQVGTGQPALPVYAVSNLQAEWEILLPRGTQLRILGRSIQKIDGQEVVVIRAVAQGRGDVLPASKIGTAELPPAESVVKAESRTEAKFVYDLSDLREASMG